MQEDFETLMFPIDGVVRAVRLAKYPQRRFLEWITVTPLYAFAVACVYFLFTSTTPTYQTFALICLLLTMLAIQHVERRWERRRANWIAKRWLVCEVALQHPDLLRAELAKAGSAGADRASTGDRWPGELHVPTRTP